MHTTALIFGLSLATSVHSGNFFSRTKAIVQQQQSQQGPRIEVGDNTVKLVHEHAAVDRIERQAPLPTEENIRQLIANGFPFDVLLKQAYKDWKRKDPKLFREQAYRGLKGTTGHGLSFDEGSSNDKLSLVGKDSPEVTQYLHGGFEVPKHPPRSPSDTKAVEKQARKTLSSIVSYHTVRKAVLVRWWNWVAVSSPLQGLNAYTAFSRRGAGNWIALRALQIWLQRPVLTTLVRNEHWVALQRMECHFDRSDPTRLARCFGHPFKEHNPYLSAFNSPDIFPSQEPAAEHEASTNSAAVDKEKS